jgi:hypothetical protein
MDDLAGGLGSQNDTGNFEQNSKPQCICGRIQTIKRIKMADMPMRDSLRVAVQLSFRPSRRDRRFHLQGLGDEQRPGAAARCQRVLRKLKEVAGFRTHLPRGKGTGIAASRITPPTVQLARAFPSAVAASSLSRRSCSS